MASKVPFTFAAPTSIFKTNLQSIDSNMPNLTCCSTEAGKEYDSYEVTELPAKLYFAEFRDFLLNNHLFLIYKDSLPEQRKSSSSHSTSLNKDSDIDVTSVEENFV